MPPSAGESIDLVVGNQPVRLQWGSTTAKLKRKPAQSASRKVDVPGVSKARARTLAVSVCDDPGCRDANCSSNALRTANERQQSPPVIESPQPMPLLNYAPSHRGRRQISLEASSPTNNPFQPELLPSYIPTHREYGRPSLDASRPASAEHGHRREDSFENIRHTHAQSRGQKNGFEDALAEDAARRERFWLQERRVKGSSVSGNKGSDDEQPEGWFDLGAPSSMRSRLDPPTTRVTRDRGREGQSGGSLRRRSSVGYPSRLREQRRLRVQSRAGSEDGEAFVQSQQPPVTTRPIEAGNLFPADPPLYGYPLAPLPYDDLRSVSHAHSVPSMPQLTGSPPTPDIHALMSVNAELVQQCHYLQGRASRAEQEKIAAQQSLNAAQSHMENLWRREQDRWKSEMDKRLAEVHELQARNGRLVDEREEWRRKHSLSDRMLQGLATNAKDLERANNAAVKRAAEAEAAVSAMRKEAEETEVSRSELEAEMRKLLLDSANLDVAVTQSSGILDKAKGDDGNAAGDQAFLVKELEELKNQIEQLREREESVAKKLKNQSDRLDEANARRLQTSRNYQNACQEIEKLRVNLSTQTSLNTVLFVSEQQIRNPYESLWNAIWTDWQLSCG